MDLGILIFLGLAAFIVLMAVLVPRLFRKSIERDKLHEDLNRDQHDGRGTATWIGIRRGSDEDIDP